MKTKNNQIDITLHKNFKDSELLLKSFQLMKPVLGRFILGLVVVLINVVLTIILPRLIGQYMDAIDIESVTDSSVLKIVLICSTYLIIVVLNAIFTYIQVVIFQKASQTIVADLRQKSFDKIMSLSHSQLSQIPVGRLVTRVNNDTNSINEMYTQVFANLVKYSLTIIGIYVNMLFINPILTGYISIIFVLLVILTIICRSYSRKAFSEERKQVSNLNSFLSENLSGVKITQIFNQEERKSNDFDKTNKALLKAKKSVMYVFSIYRPAISLLYFTSVAIVFFCGFNMIEENMVFFNQLFNFGLLVSYYNYTVSFFGPVQHLADQLDKLQSGLVALTRTFNLLDMEEIIKDDEDAIEINSFKGKIEFKNVWFKYVEDEWVLKDVSFVIEPGETVAFVGSTGSGKTTILSLIVRNYDIQKGQILIDGIDIKKIKLESLRKNIGQMLQDVFMFSGSIIDNITLKDNRYNDEEVVEAIKYVNADKFIFDMEKGLDTEVSENGSNFSSGQRQLISFARTIIAKPQILILDEATANIDTETEMLIQDSLLKMKNIGTMLVVAHRLSTIQHADNIICLSHGRIIEQGNHQELLKKENYYYKLYQFQFKDRL